jgi:hypothetical protein
VLSLLTRAAAAQNKLSEVRVKLLRTQKKRQDGLSSVSKLEKRQELCQTASAQVDKVATARTGRPPRARG